MHIVEGWTWRGDIEIVHRDLAGRTIKVARRKNLITNLGLNLVRDLLDGTATDTGGINYVALGSGSTAPAAGDTALANETFRKQVTQQATAGTGKLTTTLYVAPSEAVGAIAELGWFIGATAVAGSGRLVARVLYEHTKTSAESLTISRTDTLARS